MDKVDPRFRIAYLLSNRTGEISLLSGFCALLMSIGFLLGGSDIPNANYYQIFEFASYYVWAFLFGVYGMITTSGCLYRIPGKIRMLNGIVGIWAWTYIFLSFTFFDSSPIAPTEYLLAVPIVTEVWNMLSLPHPNKWRRKDDRNAGCP